MIIPRNFCSDTIGAHASYAKSLPSLVPAIRCASWMASPFDDPIKPPKGRPLVTLKDAAAYILKLPKSAQQSPE
jgi:hypothetical protein